MAYTPSSVYASGDDLILTDEDIKQQSETFKKLGKQLQSTVDTYIAYLEKLKNYGLISGEAANALSVYIDYCKKLDGVFEKMGNTYSVYLEQYLQDVDKYDEELYG